MKLYTVMYYDFGQQGCNEDVAEIVDVIGVATDLEGVEAIIKENEGGSLKNVHLVNQDVRGKAWLSSTANKQSVYVFDDEEAEDDNDAMGVYVIQLFNANKQLTFSWFRV